MFWVRNMRKRTRRTSQIGRKRRKR
ncbi:hypothetical protein E2C01_088951 [Portunus trituberculatus]|uniref:Uncharacterized protein n=1 Tax=Portunus trituberculatus TaxID=210409 RepID=A0A5B7JG06_PORTR|nr:hypothetical protein [Portunus trituberculatus]